MKLKEIVASMINIQSEILLPSKNTQRKNGNQTITEIIFDSVDVFRTAIEQLHSINILTEDALFFKDSILFKTKDNTVTVQYIEGDEIRKRLLSFYKNFQTILNSFKAVIPEEKESSIGIKLPPIQDFEDLSNIASDFQKILSQTIIHNDIDGKIEITSVENGSIWLYVYLGSAAAVSLVGSMAWASAVIYKKIQEGRILESKVRELKIREDSFKEIQGKQTELLSHVVEAEAQLLVDKHYKDKKPEQIERMKNSIKMLANIIDKGGEIHPSISAPESVTNLFPNSKNIQTITSKIKAISSGNEEKNN